MSHGPHHPPTNQRWPRCSHNAFKKPRWPHLANTRSTADPASSNHWSSTTRKANTRGAFPHPPENKHTPRRAPPKTRGPRAKDNGQHPNCARKPTETRPRGKVAQPFPRKNPLPSLAVSSAGIVVAGPPYVRVDHCMYGAPYRKRTRIWTHGEWTPKLCDRSHLVNGRHKMTAQRGPSRNCCSGHGDRCTLDQLHRLPAELCREIYNVALQQQAGSGQGNPL